MEDNEKLNQVALQTSIGYIEAHRTDEGVDYTLYDVKLSPVDGGVIEDTSLSALDAAMQVCKENRLANPKEINHEEFMSNVHEAEDRNVELMNEFLMKPPVYKETAAYAIDNGEIDLYRRSLRVNVECRMAIEDAIADGYDGQRLDTGSVKDIIQQFGAERVGYVLANTVQQKDWDGRFSHENKEWAKGISVCPEKAESFIVDKAHSGLTNLFVSAARKELRETERAAEKPSIREQLKAIAKELEPKKPTAKMKEHGAEL